MTAPGRRRYKIRDYMNRRAGVMLALGFSSGLPYNLIGNTMGYWLADEQVKLSAITLLSWVTFVYSLKFLWSPFIDRLNVPLLGRLGRRRGWMALNQIVIGAGLFTLAAIGTSHGLVVLGAIALVVAIAAATQDTSMDAWRIEVARDDKELGLLTSAYTIGFRVALLGTEAIILPIAQRLGWHETYIAYAALAAVGLIATLFFATEPLEADAVLARKEKERPLWTPRGMFDGIAGPFIAFFKTHGVTAFWMLLAISLFQLPNFVSGPVYGPMYVALGLSKDMVGGIRGTAGLAGTFLGVAVAGIVVLKLGWMRALLVGGASLMLGVALYGLLPFAHDLSSFALIMAGENFGIALAGVTLVAYMSSLTSLGYTATQYALLSSFYALLGKFLKGFSGPLIQDVLTPHFGLLNAYSLFFFGCAALGFPALLLFWLLDRQHRRAASEPALNPA
jgi:PAT family beta-lactamase induction signal transducer AmpG